MRPILLISLLLMVHTLETLAQTATEIADIWDNQHVTAKLPSNFRHKDLLKSLGELKEAGIKVVDIGRSGQGREIFQLEWGNGPKKVFLWSQMHGDEPTATSSLIDMFAILQKNRDKDWVKALESRLTIRAVPMLNPDGAEFYQRRNSQGIDINRDARNLITAEARLLKSLRETWQPEIGFNLHNQQGLTTVGRTNKQAAISFLVVYGDEAKTLTPGLERNRRLVVAMNRALSEFMPGHIARYGDEWTPSAFGDSFSEWGTPVILIETGALHGKDEMFLVKMNFVAFLTAMKLMADGGYSSFDPAEYELIPNNSSGRIVNFIFRNATVIDRPQPRSLLIADIGVVVERRRAEQLQPTRIRQIGDLSSLSGLEEYDASGFNVTGRFQPIKAGNYGELLFYKKGREVNWASADIEKEFPPDAIFSLGKWAKGEGLLKRR
ncbi:MAG: M14 family zinc carboxypeptidase [Pyrinomonadaceae bacterium]